MAGILDSVDQRTQLAGENRLELLLFKLGSEQWYGINVFKVKEIIHSLPLTQIPKSNPVIRGVSHIRGVTIPIIDMQNAIGGDQLVDPQKCFVIITEFNRAIQGFLVSAVIKIVNSTWQNIRPPPPGTGSDCYLTAVTEVEGNLVEIIDVEKVLQEVSPAFGEVSEESKQSASEHHHEADHHKEKELPKLILGCDDSAVARKQIKRTLDQINIESVLLKNGKEALDQLKEWAEAGENVNDKLIMVISDVEMPEMDGYKLTTEIRNDPRLKDLYVVLHTSLSGVFNQALVEKVGANKFIPKFQPDTIANTVTEQMKSIAERLK